MSAVPSENHDKEKHNFVVDDFLKHAKLHQKPMAHKWGKQQVQDHLYEC